jgi:hypothetical protein
MIVRLTAAKEEVQFKKALASVKGAMPDALLINGHNPLTLLHAALSDGVHNKSDEGMSKSCTWNPSSSRRVGRSSRSAFERGKGAKDGNQSTSEGRWPYSSVNT